MEYKEIIYEVSDYIATITLNRPEKLNAWTGVMDAEYREAMALAEQDDNVRAIIVTGAGKGFCAGADMSLLQSVSSGETEESEVRAPSAEPGQNNGRADFKGKYSFPPAIKKPIICAANGACVGLGLVHAVYCDIRIASDTAKFGTAFAQRGLIAEYGLAWMLPRLIGPQHALDLLLSGRVINSQEAYDMGLVARVVPADKLMETVREYASNLATLSSPRSTAVIKRQVYDGLFTDLSTALELADEEMGQSLGCEDFREGVLSFIEKRKPEFVGK